MILDQHGRPTNSAHIPLYNEQLKGGWVQGSGIGRPHTSISQVMGVPQNRALERLAARVAFMTNPIISGAIEVMQGFVLGKGVAYGEHFDDRAHEYLEEFFAHNLLDRLTERWLYQYFVDGENLTLFPQHTTRQRAVRREPAYIGLYQVSDSLELESIPGVPHIPNQVLTQDNTLRSRDEFVWTAFKPMWNDLRGWPVIMQAVPAALSYIDFVNARIRLHKLQARINGVYKTFVFSKTAIAAEEEKKRNSAAFGIVPQDGSVLTIGKNPETGESEEFDFLRPDPKANDARQDGRMIYLLACVALQLPEHYLSFTGEVTRTTAANQDAPTQNALERHQGTVETWLNEVMRRELVRRDGTSQTYTVRKRRMLPGGDIAYDDKQVPASRYYFNWHFPEVRRHDLSDIVELVGAAADRNLASRQTLQSLLELDPAEEAERMAQEPERAEQNTEVDNDS